MPIQAWSSVVNPSSDANFTAWAQGISNALTALLVKTADTGQLAQPLALVRPAAGAFVGYEMYRFNDVQQALFPIYMKVQYGYPASVGLPGLQIGWGTGTDGAGNLTGVRVGGQSFYRSSQPAVGAVTENGASAGEGYFNLFWGGTGADGLGAQLSIGRSIGIDGVPTADAYYVFFWNGNATVFMTVPPAPLAALSRVTNVSGVGLPFLGQPENTNASEYVNLGGEVPVYPIEPFLGRRQPPLKNMAISHISNVGPGVSFETLMYGAKLRFRRVSEGSAAFGPRASAQNALAIRWE